MGQRKVSFYVPFWEKSLRIGRVQSRFDAWDRVLRDGALGRPWGIGWGEGWEGGSGWGTHVHQWLIHVNVWQNPLQYCKVISLQLKLINKFFKKRIGRVNSGNQECPLCPIIFDPITAPTTTCRDGRCIQEMAFSFMRVWHLSTLYLVPYY